MWGKVLIVEVVQKLKGKTVLSIDHPNKEKPICLKQVKWEVENLFVRKGVICNSDSSCGVSRAKLPGWVNSDDIKKSSSFFYLCSKLNIKICIFTLQDA